MNTPLYYTKFIRAALILGALPMICFGQIENNIQYIRPYGMDGVNVFEVPKDQQPAFEEFAFKWGAAFTQQFQALSHENKSTPVVVNGSDINALSDIGAGFNLATANLFLDVQLAEGIRVNVVTYLSSRHHSETWVKGGYLQVDKLPMFNSEALDNIMKYIRIKTGHYEVNYGDAHFRRSDNANAMYNPFVGNYMLDSFTTEVGGELYFMKGSMLAMAGLTGGQMRPSVGSPDTRSPSVYGKLGFDKKVDPDTRFRLTGSVYRTADKTYLTQLYNADRTGSRYYNILEDKTGSTRTPWSGRLIPGFTDGFTSFMINPFIQFKGIEFFGLYEQSSQIDASDISVTQYGAELLYRFGADKNFYLGGRYNYLEGDICGSIVDISAIKNWLDSPNDTSVDRIQIGGGWFITKNIMVKGEYMQQKYNDFAATTLYSDAKFNGFVVEGVVSF